MTTFLRLMSLLLAGILPSTLQASMLPLRHGEHLTYRVSWAIIPGAGEIKIDAVQPPGTMDRLVVTSTTSTRRLAKMLLPFEARSDNTFDTGTARLLTIHERANTRGKSTEHTVTFDHFKREAIYDKIVPEEPPRILPMPEGEPTELILALLQTRNWDLKPGDKRDTLVLFDDDFYELTLHALRYEELRTSLGTFNTLVLEPRMEKTPPKGMFKRGSTVKVWIAQGEHRLPVQFQVEFKIGTGTATLSEYRPPAPIAPAPAPAKGRVLAAPAANVNAQNPRP